MRERKASSGDGHRSAGNKRGKDMAPTGSTLPRMPGRLRRRRSRRVPQSPELLESTKHHLAACPRRGLALKRPKLFLQQFSALSHHSPVGAERTSGAVHYRLLRLWKGKGQTNRACNKTVREPR